MLDLELRRLLRRPRRGRTRPITSRWYSRKRSVAVVGEGAHRDHREARIELHRRHRVARRGADEGLLELRMGDRFGGADEAGAELARRRRPSPDSDRIASPRPMPPATNTGTSRICGRISCASTLVETGPIWPPASLPSITSARRRSAPASWRSTSAGAKQITLAPPSLSAAIAAPGGRPPASTTWPTLLVEADLDQLQRAAGAW